MKNIYLMKGDNAIVVYNSFLSEQIRSIFRKSRWSHNLGFAFNSGNVLMMDDFV